MAESVSQLSMDYPHLLDEDSGRHLVQSLLFAADYLSRKPDQYVQRIHRGMPTIILGGYDGHTATYLAWNGLFISCDRGGDRPRPLTIRQYDLTRMNPTVAKKLLEFWTLTSAQYINFRDKELPDLLGFKEVTNESTWEQLARLPLQTYGNCSLASLEGTIKAYFFLNKLRSNPNKPLQEIQNETDICFANWKFLQQILLLEKYHKDDLDPQLLAECFSSLRKAKGHPAIEKKLLERLDQLEEAHLNHELTYYEKDLKSYKQFDRWLWFMTFANVNDPRVQAINAKFLSKCGWLESLAYRGIKMLHTSTHGPQ